MTIINNRRIRYKSKNSFKVSIIIFTTLFSGFIPLIDLPEGDFHEESKIWFNPHLSDFLYENTVSINNTFNAYNESYIICSIQNIDHTFFWFNGSKHNVSYGYNLFPVDFGSTNQSYSIDVTQEDVNNDVFEYITVQPLYIKEDNINVNLDETTDISFNAGGSIAILVQPNFSYNWLYVEVDEITINNIYNTSTYTEVNTAHLITHRFCGEYIQFNLELDSGSHSLKFKGNGTLDYKIITSGDWDEDFISDAEEIQSQYIDFFMDPINPTIWGYYEQGSDILYVKDHKNERGNFVFFLPENSEETYYLDINVHLGSITNIQVDLDDTTFKNKTLSSSLEEHSTSEFYGVLTSGFHSIHYKYEYDSLIELSFSINGKPSRKSVEVYKKYRVWHKQGLIRKIKRIVGKFGINNYTSLKIFLQSKGIHKSLKYFEDLEKNNKK